jgi:hypothetical protein
MFPVKRALDNGDSQTVAERGHLRQLKFFAIKRQGKTQFGCGELIDGRSVHGLFR